MPQTSNDGIGGELYVQAICFDTPDKPDSRLQDAVGGKVSPSVLYSLAVVEAARPENILSQSRKLVKFSPQVVDFAAFFRWQVTVLFAVGVVAFASLFCGQQLASTRTAPVPSSFSLIPPVRKWAWGY